MGPLAILGPGTLGLSLARHAAEQGFEVRLAGRDASHAQAGAEKVFARWKREVTKGCLDSDKCRDWIRNLRAVKDWREAAEGAAVILEALPEELGLKAEFWSMFASTALQDVLPLTGSSSIPATLIRAANGLGPGLQNFHLFVPVRRTRLVELGTPSDTPPQFAEQSTDFAKVLDLDIVRVDVSRGLPASRLGLVQGLEAMRLLGQGSGNPADLDRLMTAGYGHPCGPLELSDRVGLDLRLAIAEHLFNTTGESLFEPPPVLRELVAQGNLGRKSGKGFFHWTPDGEKA